MGAPRVAGFPVTLTFSGTQRVTMTGFSLTDAGGAPVAAYLLAPSGATENSASLTPKAPLLPATRYTAHFAGTIGDRTYTRTWIFTTAG